MAKYSIVIFKDDGDNLSDGERVKSLKADTLAQAEQMFAHHHNMLRFSRQHKQNMGLRPKDHGKLWLFDHREGFELREEMF